MNQISIWRGSELLACIKGEEEAQLLYRGEYLAGDRIVFESDQKHVLVSVDQSIESARIYMPSGTSEYSIPMSGDNLLVYPPHAFTGDLHVIDIRPDMSNEYRNLAVNPVDQRGSVTAYPHATANVETRDESVFCARNVIDGMHIARGHGEWPYQSWGIGARTDAHLTVEFGRQVTVDQMALYLRADFPHDAYWIAGTVTLSDGYQQTFELKGVEGKQLIKFDANHDITWAKLDQLIKCDMPSAFPALRQWEIYGQDTGK